MAREEAARGRGAAGGRAEEDEDEEAERRKRISLFLFLARIKTDGRMNERTHKVYEGLTGENLPSLGFENLNYIF